MVAGGCLDRIRLCSELTILFRSYQPRRLVLSQMMFELNYSLSQSDPQAWYLNSLAQRHGCRQDHFQGQIPSNSWAHLQVQGAHSLCIERDESLRSHQTRCKPLPSNGEASKRIIDR